MVQSVRLALRRWPLPGLYAAGCHLVDPQVCGRGARACLSGPATLARRRVCLSRVGVRTGAGAACGNHATLAGASLASRLSPDQPAGGLPVASYPAAQDGGLAAVPDGQPDLSVRLRNARCFVLALHDPIFDDDRTGSQPCGEPEVHVLGRGSRGASADPVLHDIHLPGIWWKGRPGR